MGLRSKLKFAAVIPALSLLWGQQAPVDQGDPAIFRTSSRLVVLHATAVDKDGHLITSVPRSAFQIYENGVKQEIKSFRREDLPVSLGLVIDNSASMAVKRARVSAAALALVQQSNPDDEAFVVN